MKCMHMHVQTKSRKIATAKVNSSSGTLTCVNCMNFVVPIIPVLDNLSEHPLRLGDLWIATKKEYVIN